MLRPFMTVRTSFEQFEFFIFVDHSERTQLLPFSNHYCARQFLERVMSDTCDPRLLRNLLRSAGIQATLSLLTDHQVIDLLAHDLVSRRLKVKCTPLPPSQFSPAEFDYFTAQFDKLRTNDQARTPLTRSDLPSFPEIIGSLPPPQANPTSSETPVAKSSLTSTTTVSKSMTVAAVQMYSEDGKILENLNTIEKLAHEAKQANSGLDLILFPELTSAGYGVGPYGEIPVPDRQKLAQDLWSAAEPSKNNQTLQKLQTLAKELQVMIGASFLETDGKDFYVTFVLFGREGQEVGRVRKQKAAAQEAYYVTSVDTPQSHVLTIEDSKLGTLKIGVGICYENYHIQLPCHFQQEGVDLVLQPHSANIMNLDGEPLAKLYANTLGVPVVMVNKYKPAMGFPGNSAVAYFTEEGKLKVDPPDEPTKPFIKTFSLKKRTPQPLNCDLIGREPEYWPEALMQFYAPNLEVPQHLETLEVLQEYIACLERRAETPPEYLAQLKILDESIQVNLSGTKGTEWEKESSFKGVEGTGETFYNQKYVKERKNWAEKMAKPQSNSQPTPSETHDDHSDPEQHDDESKLG